MTDAGLRVASLGPVNPAAATVMASGGSPARGARPRWAGGADETAVDAFTPIPREGRTRTLAHRAAPGHRGP